MCPGKWRVGLSARTLNTRTTGLRRYYPDNGVAVNGAIDRSPRRRYGG